MNSVFNLLSKCLYTKKISLCLKNEDILYYIKSILQYITMEHIIITMSVTVFSVWPKKCFSATVVTQFV